MEKRNPSPRRHIARAWLFVLFGLLFTFAAQAQDTKVSIDADKQPLTTVLSQLEQQSGYRFFYSNDLVAGAKPVTIKASDEALSSVLKRILPERNLSYRVEKQQIILSAAKSAKKEQSTAKTPTVTVRGRVTDNTGEPLIGVSVLSGATGVATDIDGNYTIQAAPGATIEYSYIGCAPVSKKATADKPLDIVMTEDTQLLNEVVVIGYGTMDKKELTSAISHVGEKDFLTISSADPAALIKGKVSGVSIVNTGAADPNAVASIQVRGVSSREAGIGPLIVVDGVPGGSLANINPNDIASFDVLKDGAASAIYGTRGSNGVILVTTKKAAKDGSVHTTYNVTVSWDKMIRELDMLDATEFRDVRMGWGDAGSDLGGNYDWLDGVSRTGFSHKHTLSLSGGNERTNYRVSVDYSKGNGIDLRSTRKSYGGRAAINHQTKGGLFNFSVNLAPRVVYSDNADWSVFSKAIDANPTTPLMNPTDPLKYYDFQGQVAGSNPVEYQLLEQDKTDTKMLDWDATARLNLLPLLAKSENCPVTLNTQITFSDRQYIYEGTIFKPSTVTGSVNIGRTGSAVKSYTVNRQDNLEWLINAAGKFGKNNVRLLLGYSYSYYHNNGFSAENQDFPNDGLGADNLGSGEYMAKEGEVGMSSYRNSSKLISFFGRVSYDWNGKYLFTASLRREGSSKFGTNNKWGNFPAVSIGWRITQESFMEGTRSWLNDLKIRADYGVTGNQDFASYQSIATMKGYGHYLVDGKYIQIWDTENNVNPDLHWEKNKNWNIGIDFSMFNNRFSGSLNYFNRRSEDLLGTYNVPIPPYTHQRIYTNVGTMANQGFEFELNVAPVQTRDFSYDFNFIGATMKNKFISFSNSKFVGNDYYSVASVENPFGGYDLQRIEAGGPVGNFYMWKFGGINEKGEWLVQDRNGNLIELSQATDADRQIVGNGMPKFTLSTTHRFRYRDFDLSFFFTGAFDYQIFNIHDYFYGTRKYNGNVLKKAYGKNFKVSPTSPHAVTDYFLEDGDYFKLEQLTLGYTLRTPKARFLDSVRIYGSVNNVFTLTKFSGIDPSKYSVNGLTPGANGSRSYYPSTRQFIIGVQVDF